MTSTPNSSENNYPTEWHLVNTFPKMEARHISEDKVQLRSETHVATISAEGFDLFRANNAKAWNKYLKDNNIIPVEYWETKDGS